MVPEILEYDLTISEYNRTRAGSTSTNDWVSHIIDYYREAMSYDMLAALSRRGFDITT
jgi:hypothetical protein